MGNQWQANSFKNNFYLVWETNDKLTHLKNIPLRLLSVWEGVFVPKISFLAIKKQKKMKKKETNVF